MILSIYLFLCANYVATIFAYYQKCYDSLSLCLITNTNDGMEFRLNRSSADRWCKDQSSSLATITNVTVQSAIATFINDARLDRSTVVITNGYRLNLSGWEWTNGARSDLVNKGHDRRYACLLVSTGIPYLSVCSSASVKIKFICTYRLNNPSGSSCSQGYVRTGTICYKIHQQEAVWFKARILCLRDVGSDLAVFDNGLPSINLTTGLERYWIGLRTEKWTWWNGQGYDEVVNYSNWDGWSPRSSGGSGNCLCVRTSTGEWTDCDCSQNYRYICIQDYATGSALTFKPTTKKITARTPTYTLDDNPRNDVSEDPHGTGQTSVIVLMTLIVLVVLIVVVTVVSAIVIKKRRKRSTRQEGLYVNSAFQPTSSVDDYTTLRRECLTGNETYAELNVYETIEDEIYKNSK